MGIGRPCWRREEQRWRQIYELFLKEAQILYSQEQSSLRLIYSRVEQIRETILFPSSSHCPVSRPLFNPILKAEMSAQPTVYEFIILAFPNLIGAAFSFYAVYLYLISHSYETDAMWGVGIVAFVAFCFVSGWRMFCCCLLCVYISTISILIY